MPIACGQPITNTANLPIIWSAVSATEYTETTNSYVSKRALNLTLPARAIVVAIVLECDLKSPSTATAQASVSMAGGAIITPETAVNNSDNYTTYKVMGFIPTSITSAYWRETETTIDFNLRLKNPAAASTAYIKNHRVGVMYYIGYEIDDSSYITG